jgi:hypothetical protein
MFDTKIAIVVRDDLLTWQKLNVTAFLTSGIVGTSADLIGEPYEDGSGNRYSPLIRQPIIVLNANRETLVSVHRRILERQIPAAIYIEEMFSTGHDAANRAAVRQVPAGNLNIVGLAIREDKKVVDKVTKGAKLHA